VKQRILGVKLYVSASPGLRAFTRSMHMHTPSMHVHAKACVRVFYEQISVRKPSVHACIHEICARMDQTRTCSLPF